MVGCVAIGCKRRSEKGVKMHRFPADPERRNRWLITARRTDIKDTTHKRLCDAHFEDDQYKPPRKGQRRLRLDAAPTLFSHIPKKKKRKPPTVRTFGPPKIVPGEHSYAAVRKNKVEEKTPSKDTAETLISTKDGAEIGLPVQDGAETGISTNNVAKAENSTEEKVKQKIPTKDIAAEKVQSKVTAKTDVPEMGPVIVILTKDRAETEIPPDFPWQNSAAKVAKSRIAMRQELSKTKSMLEEQVAKSRIAMRQELSKMKSMLEEQKKAAEKAKIRANKAEARLKHVRRQKRCLLRRIEVMTTKLSKVFTKDQIKALGVKNTQGLKWGNDSIEKAFQILFAAGPTGYQTLQDLHIPLPAVRTLQKRMEGLKFEPGILEEVFAILKIKAEGMSELERDCVLTIDEMTITQSVEVHKGTGRQFGEVTLPGHTGPATRTCVFMLVGATTTQWQEIVAYHYSGDSTQGEVYKPIILEIIQKAQAIGLHVIGVTTDMASPNQAMWRAFGVDHNNTSVPHPVTPDRQLYFMPDVPHLVKNMRNALVSGHVIALPDNVMEKENFTTNLVSLEPIKDLINFQEGTAQKIAPKLSRNSIEPTLLEKKKVGPAKSLFSLATSAALKHMVEKEGRPKSHLATAWFIEQVSRWVDLMSFRHPVTALSSLNTPEYETAKVFLNSIVDLFCNISIGATGEWTPIQTGVVMATRSMLAIQEEMLAKGHTFVLTARFTLENLEGLFSCIRYRNPSPTPVGVQKALKVISVGQFDSSDTKKWELPGRPRGPSRLSAKIGAKRKACSPGEGGESKKVPRERKKQKIGKSDGQRGSNLSKSPTAKPHQTKKAKKAVTCKRPRATGKVSNPLLVSMNTVDIPVPLTSNTSVSYISDSYITSPSYTYTSL